MHIEKLPYSRSEIKALLEEKKPAQILFEGDTLDWKSSGWHLPNVQINAKHLEALKWFAERWTSRPTHEIRASPKSNVIVTRAGTLNGLAK